MSTGPPGLVDSSAVVMSEQDRLAHENAVLSQNNAHLQEQVRLAKENAVLVAENARLAEELAHARLVGACAVGSSHIGALPPAPWPDPYAMHHRYPIGIPGYPNVPPVGYYPGSFSGGGKAGMPGGKGDRWPGGCGFSAPSRLDPCFSQSSTRSRIDTSSTMFTHTSSINSAFSQTEDSEADDRDARDTKSKRRQEKVGGPITTAMMRNIPNDYTRELLLKLLDDAGFNAAYDLLYLPIDFKSQVGLGYAFINFVSDVEAQRFKQHFQGFKNWSVPSEKVCEISWSDVVQGLHDNVQRYRNSPVMHESVQDAFKPALFQGGGRVDFPEPTKTIRPPRKQERRPENRSSGSSGCCAGKGGNNRR